MRRTSVLRSKALAQGEFTSPEHERHKGPLAGLSAGDELKQKLLELRN